VTDRPSSELVDLLEACRARERAQTRFYRALAAEAELRGAVEAAERLNALHADEQHHLSRLTARLLELGGRPLDLPEEPIERPDLDTWEMTARRRETGEVSWYEKLIDRSLDAVTASLLEEILVSERRHRDELGGKWMSA
jgi:rubrerythrin